MKEAMAGVSISAAVPKGPLISLTPSFSGPKAPSIFEGGFRPFTASPSSVREGPIGSPKSIFSERAWSTVFTPEPKPSAPNLDTIFPDTKPLKSLDFGIKEGPANIRKGEWTTVVKNSEAKSVKNSVVGTIEALSFEPEPRVKAEDKERERHERIRQVRLAILAEMLKVSLAEKQDKKKAQTVAKAQPQAKSKEEEVDALTQLQVHNMPLKEEEKVEEKTKQRKVSPMADLPPFPVSVVDKLVQQNRKKTVREKVATAFRISRLIKAPYVSGREIAPQLEEKKEHKSRLLYQLDAHQFADGSFNEAVKDIERLPRVYNISGKAELFMQDAAEGVLDRHMAVKLSEADYSRPATRRETRKVLKYVLEHLPWA